MRLEIKTERMQFLATRAPEPKTDQEGRQKRDARTVADGAGGAGRRRRRGDPGRYGVRAGGRPWAVRPGRGAGRVAVVDG